MTHNHRRALLPVFAVLVAACGAFDQHQLDQFQREVVAADSAVAQAERAVDSVKNNVGLAYVAIDRWEKMNPRATALPYQLRNALEESLRERDKAQDRLLLAERRQAIAAEKLKSWLVGK